jgi:Zn-dependent M28 family amino/carboxypeptidase
MTRSRLAALAVIAALGAPGAGAVTLVYKLLDRSVIERRVGISPRKNADRLEALEGMFQEAGCAAVNVARQPVKHARQPNLVCTLPGATDSVLIVGAHFDKVNQGDGVIDNWSGASLLPSLYQSIAGAPRRHTIVFVAFTDEEAGLVGSKFYAGKLSAADIGKTHGMVNLDSLGLSPSKLWASHADPAMANALAAIAQTLKAPLAGVNPEKVGSSDSESFRSRKVPSLTVHSVTQETLGVLHSTRDNINALHLDEYYETYRLLAAYLAYLDATGENGFRPEARPAAGTP